MPPQFNSLPTQSSSSNSPRSSLPILSTRRRLVNKPQPSSSPTIDVHSSPLFQVATPTRATSTSGSSSRNNDSDYTALSTTIPISPPTSRLKKTATKLHRSSSPASLIAAGKGMEDSLKGVVACLDIRTEDGDDVSQNFENALKSMGAKTRKTFADSVTHLVYKNGSAINVRKALHNNCKIVNLLWITNCKSQGKRLPEDNYLINQPENLLLSSSKRRKSMEPGRVKALILGERSDTSSHYNEDDNISKRQKTPNSKTTRPPLNLRRKTVSHWETSAIISKEATNSHYKSDMSLELGDLNLDLGIYEDTEEASPPPTSHLLPRPENRNKKHLLAPTAAASVSRSMRRLSFKDEPDVCPPVSRKPTVTKEIKAAFFMNTHLQQPSSSPSSSFSPASLSPASSSSSSSSSPATLIRRQRRSLSHQPVTTTRSNSTTTIKQPLSLPCTIPDTSKSSPVSTPLQQTTLDRVITRTRVMPTIVMTNMDVKTKKKCALIIKRLGKYQLASSVDEKTTHVIVGSQRRTESVILGLLYTTWLVTPEWLLDSDSSYRYLDELPYEATHFYPRARAARQKDPLLPSNISIYISSTTMPLDFVRHLITKAGGQVTDSLQDADIVIQNSPTNSPIITVTDNWLLDSIEHWRYLSTTQYNPISP